MATSSLPRPQAAIPIWRDTRYIAILLQIAFVVVVVFVATLLYNNMMAGLRSSNLLPSLSFLDTEAGIPISEGIAYSPSDNYRRAFIVGLVNTLRVAFFGIIFASSLGLVVGVSRLSTNWLVRKSAEAYVEIVRNIPLLVQLLFWLTVTQTFPRTQESLNLFGLMHLTNRGVFVAWPRPSPSFGMWQLWLIGALLVGGAVFAWRTYQLKQQDRPGIVLPWALLAAAGVAAVGFGVTALLGGQAPLLLEIPVLDRFNFRGGATLSTNFAALLFGLTIYTAAFIGEIVRAGILAVSKGQREAAKALGLTEFQSLRLIILPQALRVIIPPTTNQYLNLTKNSSLAVAIGYPDLFAIGFTIFNQTGQVVPMMLIIMGCYLTISLTTSALMNLYNRRIQLVER